MLSLNSFYPKQYFSRSSFKAFKELLFLFLCLTISFNFLSDPVIVFAQEQLPGTDQYTRRIQNSYEGEAETEFQLGQDIRDDDPSVFEKCTRLSNSPIANRRVGICNDGIYSQSVQLVDSSGNYGEVVNKDVERDTVRPDMPRLDLQIAGEYFEQYLSLTVEAEAHTRLEVSIDSLEENVLNSDYEFEVNEEGFYYNSEVARLVCGSEYIIKAKLYDRASNVSEEFTQKFEAKACPQCTSQGVGDLILPLRESDLPAGHTISISGYFPRYFISKHGNYYGGAHAGIDFAVPGGMPVYASREGVVKKAVYSFGHNNSKSSVKDPGYKDGWANTVILSHVLPSGAKAQTIYAHLQPEINPIVKPGQLVKQGQLIGYIGSTGASTGFHLHFQLEVQGVKLNPIHNGKYNLYSPVNALAYLGDIKGNLTSKEQEVFCQNSQVKGSSYDLPNFPEVGKEQAQQAVVDYISKYLTGKTEIESYESSSQKTTILEEIQIKDLADQISVFQTPCKVYIQHLGKIEFKEDLNNLYPGSSWPKGSFDGGLVVDPYSSPVKAEIVLGHIWEEYYHSGMACGPVGVPIGRQKPNNYRILSTEQSFKRTEAYNNNKIYSFLKNTQRRTYYIVSEVAKTFIREGGLESYGFPKNSTYGRHNNFCKQDFEREWKGSRHINECPDVEKSFLYDYVDKCNTPTGVGCDFKEGDFHYNNYRSRGNLILFYSPEGSKSLESYVTEEGLEREVWIVSHGMNSNEKTLKNIAEGLKETCPEDIIFIVDWSESARSDYLNPHVTSPSLRPLAEKIKERLNEWGMQNPYKLNLIGHSMGTILSSEISDQFDSQTNLIVALDPPRSNIDMDWFKSSTNKDYFVTDYRNPKKVPRFFGFQNKSKYVRSFVGKESFCGNYDFNHSADESFLIYFPDFEELNDIDLEDMNVEKLKRACEHHSAVPNVFAKLLKDGGMRDQRISLTEPVDSGLNENEKVSRNKNMIKQNYFEQEEWYPKDKVHGVFVAPGESKNRSEIKQFYFSEKNTRHITTSKPLFNDLNWALKGRKGIPFWYTFASNGIKDKIRYTKRISFILTFRHRVIEKHGLPLWQRTYFGKEYQEQNSVDIWFSVMLLNNEVDYRVLQKEYLRAEELGESNYFIKED